MFKYEGQTDERANPNTIVPRSEETLSRGLIRIYYLPFVEYMNIFVDCISPEDHCGCENARTVMKFANASNRNKNSLSVINVRDVSAGHNTSYISVSWPSRIQ